jgi:hypothetical protein
MASAEKAVSEGSGHAARAAAYWDVEDVVRFFEEHGFPTGGVRLGEVDGATLLSLWDDDEAAEVFTAGVPDGLGFDVGVFNGRFKDAMAAVQEAEEARLVRVAAAACVARLNAWKEKRGQRKFRAAQELRRGQKIQLVNRMRGQGLVPGPAEAHLELMRACLARL